MDLSKFPFGFETGQQIFCLYYIQFLIGYIFQTKTFWIWFSYNF